MKNNKCRKCGIRIHAQRLYCGYDCKWSFYYEKQDALLASGLATGKDARKYLIRKYGSKCMECGWDRINPTTNKCPIELEHIDGDWQNNKIDNIKLICPNCHSLTSTYKALNKGKGRRWHREHYHKMKPQ